MAGAGGAGVMEEGQTVILEHKNAHSQSQIQFVFLKKGQTVKIAKGNVSHESLIGHPFGTTFEVVRNKASPVSEDANEEILDHLKEDPDLLNNFSEDVNSKDNRALVDATQHGKAAESSQKLSSEEVLNLKKSGAEGKEIIKNLIENSETFKNKTEYSQAKWLKKKAQKYVPRFTTARPTSLTMCQAYFNKEPQRIAHMREDSLARLLTNCNVQAGSRALVIDSTCGLVLGAVAERMGGVGRILHGFNGLQPSVDAVRWFNFQQDVLNCILHFPLSELGFLDQDVSELNEEANPQPMEGAAAKDEGTASGGTVDVLQRRKRRLKLGAKPSMSHREVTVVEPTLADIQKELREGFDTMVIAGSLHPGLLVPRLIPLLKTSSPFVIYSPVLQPLLDLEEELIRANSAMDMNISETWMREIQVLPGRSHPNMSMSAQSGFLLTGVRVQKRTAREENNDGELPAGGVKTESADATDTDCAEPPSKKTKLEPAEAIESKEQGEEGQSEQ